jgi:hypothetical protein
MKRLGFLLNCLLALELSSNKDPPVLSVFFVIKKITLVRVKITFVRVKITLMRVESTRMRVESTRMRIQNL